MASLSCNKARAVAAAREAGVPVLGSSEPSTDVDELVRAAARDGLDEDGEADAVGGAHQFVDVGGGLRGAEDGDAGLPGGGDGACLVAGQLQDRRAGADEGDAGLLAGAGQVGVLGEEPVTRVDGVRAGPAGGPDDLLDGEVGPDRVAGLADLVRLVGLQPVEGVAVLVREDGDRARAQLVSRAERADGDLPAVGDQHLAEHSRSLQPAGDEDHGVVATPGTPCEPGHSRRAVRGRVRASSAARRGSAAPGRTAPPGPPSGRTGR
jgi:hypothetical protein